MSGENNQQPNGSTPVDFEQLELAIRADELVVKRRELALRERQVALFETMAAQVEALLPELLGQAFGHAPDIRPNMDDIDEASAPDAPAETPEENPFAGRR